MLFDLTLHNNIPTNSVYLGTLPIINKLLSILLIIKPYCRLVNKNISCRDPTPPPVVQVYSVRRSFVFFISFWEFSISFFHHIVVLLTIFLSLRKITENNIVIAVGYWSRSRRFVTSELHAVYSIISDALAALVLAPTD